MNNIKVSVVICTYTAERMAGVFEAIQSARGQTCSPQEILLVIDSNKELFNRLSEGPAGVAKVLLNDGDTGVSAARNVGILAAKGDVVAFLDDDTVAEPDWLERLVSHYQQDQSVVGVGGESLLSWANGKPPFWFPWEFDWVLGGTMHKRLVANGQEVYTISDPNMSFRREVLLSAGLWRVGLGQQMRAGKSVRGGDIAEICYRIRQRYPRGRFIFDTGAVMYHRLLAPRARLAYYLGCAFLEGSTRARVDRDTQIGDKGKHTFPSHQTYLSNLVKMRLPARLLRLYRPSAAAQLLVILLTLALMIAGYIRERIQEMKHF